jgi:Mn2+/Fe2+ NRAMP family transporter
MYELKQNSKIPCNRTRIHALILAAVINAVVTVPILFIVMRLANDKKILEDKINTRFSNIIGWFTFAIMTISVIVMFLSFFVWS